ncbi:ABC transporter permease [Streptomyces sp. CA-111067]|uniref:ABC transporter permease n=1 Tax=Streptomyces sp. CA-111067 TaxID=3240046 RepID=UPI003D951B8C
MSTLTASAPAAGAAPAIRGRVTQRRVLHSEWIKLRSLRSTFYTLLTAVVMMIGFGLLFCAVNAHNWPTMSAHDRADFEPALTSVRGYIVAQLAVGVLGVLVVSGEYATGMIRATLAAVPLRLPVLWAKAGLYMAVVWTLMTASALIAFFSGQSLLSPKHIDTTLGEPGVLRVVLGTGLYLTLVGLLGVAIGALIRNTAGGIATVFGILMVLPALAETLPASWADHVNQWLPSNAGQSVLSLHHQAHTLAPWTGLAVFCLYALLALAGAAVALRRRDA